MRTAMLVVLVAMLVACGHPKHRDSGPELTAEEAGVYTAAAPESVATTPVDNRVLISWTQWPYAEDFVVLRRYVRSNSWTEIAVVPNQYRHREPIPKRLEFADTPPVSGVEYVYGIKTRNYNKDRVLIESRAVETAPIAAGSEKAGSPASSSILGNIAWSAQSNGVQVIWESDLRTGTFQVVACDVGSPYWLHLAAIGAWADDSALLGPSAESLLTYSFLDTEVPSGRKVIYGVRVRDTAGKEGPVVEALEVTVP
jgi:hypothetical protein